MARFTPSAMCRPRAQRAPTESYMWRIDRFSFCHRGDFTASVVVKLQLALNNLSVFYSHLNQNYQVIEWCTMENIPMHAQGIIGISCNCSVSITRVETPHVLSEPSPLLSSSQWVKNVSDYIHHVRLQLALICRRGKETSLRYYIPWSNFCSSDWVYGGFSQTQPAQHILSPCQ